MSDRSHVTPAPEGEYFEESRFAGLSLLCGGIGIVFLILSFVGAFMSPVQFSFSWLFAFIFFFTLCTGCLFWTIVHHVVDAEWSVVVRRQLENIGLLIPVLAVLFLLPIWFVRKDLYRWTDIPMGLDPALDAKRGYLNWQFFLIRAIFFFVALTAVAYFLRRFSVRQDRDGNPQFTIWMRKAAFIGLPVFAFCLTFGAFDWLMSLNWRWFSTMWGPYIFAGTAGSSMSLLVLVTTALKRAGYLKVVTLEHYHIMGKWMLAFSVFWAYIGFSQYMLYWYANIPEETQWFIVRNTESWNVLNWILVIGRFFVPFAILLLRSVKKQPLVLSCIAGWIVFMQLLDMYIIVLPALHGTGVHLSVLDFLPLIGMGGTLAFLYLQIVGKTSMFPVRDPRLIESLRLTN